MSDEIYGARPCFKCGAPVQVIGEVSKPVCLPCIEYQRWKNTDEGRMAEGQTDLHDEYMNTVLRLLTPKEGE